MTDEQESALKEMGSRRQSDLDAAEPNSIFVRDNVRTQCFGGGPERLPFILHLGTGTRLGQLAELGQMLHRQRLTVGDGQGSNLVEFIKRFRRQCLTQSINAAWYQGCTSDSSMHRPTDA